MSRTHLISRLSLIPIRKSFSKKAGGADGADLSVARTREQGIAPIEHVRPGENRA